MTPYRQDHKPAASGVLLPNIEARIIDDKGYDVLEGQPGELLVRCVPCPLNCIVRLG
jgi:acyl-coenzyme A synthetase/AMP-(fatty) acid ligase